MHYRVFMDTNIYEKANYSFHSAAFQRLKELAADGQLTLLKNSVIEGEVRSHIKKNIRDQVNQLNKVIANRAFAAFRGLDMFKDIVKKKDPQEWISVCDAEFTKLLEACKAEEVSAEGIDVEKIVKDYFEQNPPFEAKKPEEFKDAIAVSALIQDIRRCVDQYVADGTKPNDIQFCVISNDNGFRSALMAGLRDVDEKYVRIFSELIHFINTVRKDQQTAFLRSFLLQEGARDVIEEIVREAVENAVIDIALEYDEFIEEQEITDIKEISFEPYILDISKENEDGGSSAEIALDVKCLIEVTYMYTDEENSYWDKEDGAYLWKEEIEKKGTYTAEFQISFSADITNCRVPEHWDPKDHHDYKDNFIEFIDYLDAPAKIDLDWLDLVAESVLRKKGPYYEYPYDGGIARESAYTYCPDCGVPIGAQNDGGNGYCVNCAPNH